MRKIYQKCERLKLKNRRSKENAENLSQKNHAFCVRLGRPEFGPEFYKKKLQSFEIEAHSDVDVTFATSENRPFALNCFQKKQKAKDITYYTCYRTKTDG